MQRQQPSASPPASPLRQQIANARLRLRTLLLGGASAMEACGGYAQFCDRLVAEHVAPKAESHFAVIATGGWGRTEMCPYSDLDILFLVDDVDVLVDNVTADARENPDKRPLADIISEDILFPLWDAGLKVGHSVSDVASIEPLARADVRTATALLDARLIAGRADLFLQLDRACRRAIAPGGDPRLFVSRLIDERDRRHQRFGESLYLLEPNLKHGIGGLRDLATALWVAQVRFGMVSAEGLVSSGKLTKRQATVLRSSRDFLLRLRSLVQLFAARATDQLTFELQEEIAPHLYPQLTPEDKDTHRAVAPAVEALMRDTYLHGSGVTQVVSQLFEAAQTPRRRRPTVARIDGSFVLFSGKLSVSSVEVFERRPDEMLRAFRLACNLDVEIHWHTRELMAERTSHGIYLSTDPRAAQLFVDALCDENDRRAPSCLEEMHRVGLVAAVIPAFGPCTGRVQHDLYHVYTVDQHQLHAVNMLKRFGRGELFAKHPLASEIWNQLEDTRSLFLATLLHDVGKPLGKGHSETGAIIARETAIRLGFSLERASRTEFLVRHHLTMSHVSQRRDLGDPMVIERFAARVGSIPCLQELTLLTICDAAMTAPGNLSPWKSQLLNELYRRTHAAIAGGTPAGDEVGATLIYNQLSKRRDRVTQMLDNHIDQTHSQITEALDDHLVSALTVTQLHRLLSLVRAFQQQQRQAPAATRPSQAQAPAFAFNVRAFPRKGHTELAVVAHDIPGLLVYITGALALGGLEVSAAVIGNIEFKGFRWAANVFFVNGPNGDVTGPSDLRWQRVANTLTEVLADPDNPSMLAKRLQRKRQSGLRSRVTPHVPTDVRFAKSASQRYAVLEVFTQDRPGLLSDMTHALRRLDLEIVLAKISTEGERATDVFYVLNTDGSLPTEKRCTNAVATLTAAMKQDGERTSST